MKKYLKLYAKKTLALFMAVMMLMTCWVFIAPEKAEAYKTTYDVKVTISGVNKAEYTHRIIFYNSAGTADERNWSYPANGTNGTETFSLTYWPTKIYFQLGSKAVAEASIDTVKINDVIIFDDSWKLSATGTGDWFLGIESKDDVTFEYNGAVGSWSFANYWTVPECTYLDSAIADQTINIPNGGGSKSASFTPVFTDQYGVLWSGTTGYTYSLEPSGAGTLSYSNKTVTVSATESNLDALISAKKYDVDSGIGTAKLTISCGKATASCNVNLQSPSYTVTFKDAKGDLAKPTCYYNGSVSAPGDGRAKTADEKYHYAFKEWGDKVYANIKANKTVEAIYTEIGHDFSGAFRDNGDGTHSLMCTGEGADEPCTFYGIKTEQGNITKGTIKCTATKWGGDNTLHTGKCKDCGHDLSHAPVRATVVDPKYRASEADCDSPATYYESCSVCGQAITSYTFTDGDELGHAWVVDPDRHVPNTCKDPGYDVLVCERCGEVNDKYVYEDSEGNLLYPAKHTWNTGPARDMGNGYHSYQCIVENCGVWDESRKVKHNYNQGGFAQKADCENDGIVNFTCGGCGATTTSKYKFDAATKEFTTELVAPKLDHNWVKVVNAERPEILPTCTTPGSYWVKCTRGGCGEYEQRTHEINPDAHNYLDAVPNDNDTHTAECEYCHNKVTASCKDFDENKDCVCDKCKDPIAHDYQNIVSADKLVSVADCNSYAVYYKSCSICGTASDETFEDVDAGYGAHKWSETIRFNKSVAKCETDAVYYYECLECGMSSEDFDGSTWTDVGTGYAHVFKGTIVNNNDGTHSYTCSNVDADGVACTAVGGTVDCSYGEWDKENANGHTHTCLDCGYTTPVEAHNWGEGWKPAADNTDSAAGKMTRTCTVCSRVETTDCQYGAGVVYEANCMHDKYTEYTCSDCGHGYTVIEAGTKLDHSYTGAYDIDAENDQHRQLCVNGCNEYGEWSSCTLDYSQIAGTETHTATCPHCGNIDTGACSGGSATCIKKAECDKCDGEYGDYAPHNFAGAARNEGEGKHSYNCTTPGCTEYGVGSVIGAKEDCFGGTAYCDAKKVCEACNTAYGEFDPNNHKNTTDMPGLDPTCMAEGYTAYKQCDNKACNAELGKETIPVNPDAHKWNTEAHSTNDGKHYYACEYNADHKNVIECFCSDPVVKAPTCEEDGYTLHTCDECGYQWTTDPTTAIGHDYGEWITDENKTGHYRVCKNDEKHIETGICAESATSVVTAPTCTEKGYTTYTCTECGNTWKADYTDATGHTYTQKIIDAAHLFTTEDYEACGITSNTCERADYYWFDCKDCDKNGKDETATDKYPLNTRYYENGKGEGHKFTGESYSEEIADKLVLKSAATCTDHEVYYTYCVECYLSTKGIEGKEATFTRWGTAISHDYQEIVDENDLTKNRVSVATCTAKAVYKKSCVNCGEAHDKDTFTYGEMTDHLYTKKMSDYAHIITEANCTTVATYWYNCEYCNSNAKMIDKDGMTEAEIAALQYTDGTVNPNNHGTLIKVPFKAPTCKEDGHSEYRVCSLCSKEIGKITAGYEQKNHSFKGEYKIVNVVDADGNVTAYKHQRACEYGCGEYSAATDCGFTAWTQNADGATHSKSCVCGNKITANCEADSNASCEEAATCKDCKGVVGTFTGHDWGEWKSDENGKTHSRVCKTNSKHVETANCSGGVASGCGAIYCSVCNQQYATGVDHAWGDWVEIQAATCVTPAVRKRACTQCSVSEEETYGKALGHDYDKDNDGINDYVVTKEATCTDAGIKTFTCLNGCGETYTEVIKALGHELAKEWTTVLEPTCADEGKKIRKCIHTWKDADGNTVSCDYFEERTIPANKDGHVAGDWIPDEGSSNCVTGLKSYKYCTVCGKVVDEKEEKIAHAWEAEVIVYGTCTANGYIQMICSKCGSKTEFNEKTPGFPNKLDETVIDGAVASKLLSKGGHKWATKPTGTADYVIQNGCVVYIKTAATCSKYGSGYMVCTAEDCHETKTVSINKTEHSFKTMPASAATCQTPGHTEYLACRNCSYAEKPTTIPKLGHVDTDKSGKCDRCGFQMYTPPTGGTAGCGCMCHDDSFFIAKIIYPIARFFWKLFKTNKACNCGHKHY